MNVSAAFEYALGQTLRSYAEIGGDTTVRVWQNLRADSSWRDSAEGDKALPCIDIRCTPPQRDDNQVGLTVTATVEIRTKAEDDRDHSEISGIFDAVQEHLDDLFDQIKDADPGDEYGAFLEIMTAELGETINIGGFTFGDSSAPYEDDGQLVIAVAFVLHYARR